ncbi:MAG: hypothetical protein MZW92_58475 [Comamonadaceae bacterium]|nr:hypothetical protein [Comamonadaceae bacterium]
MDRPRRTSYSDARPADAAVLHLLLDVRLPARRRPDLGRRPTQRARGFLLGATAGRTTLAGEGLQHQDGTSHLLAAHGAQLRAPTTRASRYELARDRRTTACGACWSEQDDVFYYVTVMNENYAAAARCPDGARDGHRCAGMYRLRAGGDAAHAARAVRLLGAGTILREALAAAELLERDWRRRRRRLQRHQLHRAARARRWTLERARACARTRAPSLRWVERSCLGRPRARSSPPPTTCARCRT